MKKVNIILSIILFGLMLTSCNKEEGSARYSYNVRMTDAPGPYDAVFIDLQGVEITGSNGKAVMMNVNAGIYNLLTFSNGMDTLIATGSLDVANVKQIRLILGPNNTVVVDKVSYPLSTPSAEQSGLKLQVNHTMEAGVQYSVLLDFDANNSIVKEGNGSYKLKPVIRTVETAVSGSIKGQISPVGAMAVITATSSSSVSYSSNAISSGYFMLIGLPAGIYSVVVTPSSPLNPVTLNNITVTTGVTTNLGVVVL